MPVLSTRLIYSSLISSALHRLSSPVLISGTLLRSFLFISSPRLVALSLPSVPRLDSSSVLFAASLSSLCPSLLCSLYILLMVDMVNFCPYMCLYITTITLIRRRSVYARSPSSPVQLNVALLSLAAHWCRSCGLLLSIRIKVKCLNQILRWPQCRLRSHLCTIEGFLAQTGLTFNPSRSIRSVGQKKKQ